MGYLGYIRKFGGYGKFGIFAAKRLKTTDMKQRNLFGKFGKMLLLTGLLLSTQHAFCQDPIERGNDRPPMMGEGRPHRGGMPENNNDPALLAMVASTKDKFVQKVFNDNQTGKTLEYNLYIPEGYNEGESYPLMMFIGDASTAGKDVSYPLSHCIGALIWATEEEQAKHPCFVLVPQYTTVTVRDNFGTTYEVEMTIRLIEALCEEYSIDKARRYTTGQSMGGMMSMYFNLAHPKFFAASLYAGCQWDTSKMGGFADDSFVYAVSAGDERASKGMAALIKVFEEEGASFSMAEWSAQLPEEEQRERTLELLAEGNSDNFIIFTKGSTLPEGVEGMEHMTSFNFIYKLSAVRDWIFSRSLYTVRGSNPGPAD